MGITHILKNSTVIRQTGSAQLLRLILAETHCGALHAPNHGSMEDNTDAVDTVVTFSCDRGYRLQGSEKRKCTTQGTWDGVEAKCIGQLLIYIVLYNSSIQY